MTRPDLRLALAPLRVRLVAAVLGLVAIGLLVSGLAATNRLHTYLQDQVDQDLSRASSSLATTLRAGGYGPGRGQASLAALNKYYVVLADAQGNGVTLPYNAAVSPPDLPERLPVDQPVTVAAEAGDLHWRVLVTQAADGSSVLFGTPLSDVDRTVDQLVTVEIVVGLVVLALLAGMAYEVVRRSLRPLREVEQTAAAIAGGDLSRRVPRQDDRTEVGRLAAAFNSMLGRIETAFSAQRASEAAARESEATLRQFVADASHELRTPLTSIRGFAELYRAGAVPPGPDLDRVMGRVEGEATRMGQLVEEMLLLARLDQQRPLERTRVDLLQLAADAAHDVRAVDPDRVISLEVDEHSEAPVVLGDEPRLRQVLVNLLGNAVTHTPAGTPVAVRLRTGEHRAVVEVVDQGAGLTAEQASQVFDRFYRADSARNRANGGSGLGLSIVRAVVEAHGGRVGVRSRPGHGATFLVDLPLAG